MESSTKDVPNQAVRDSFETADLFIHGSGPSVVKRDRIEQWRQATGKPYGICGVTIESIDERLRDLLANAQFVFGRETHTVANLNAAGLPDNAPFVGFMPDATFASDVVDEPHAEAFLKAHGMVDSGFLWSSRA